MSIPAYVCQEKTENELKNIVDLFNKGVRDLMRKCSHQMRELFQ